MPDRIMPSVMWCRHALYTNPISSKSRKKFQARAARPPEVFAALYMDIKTAIEDTKRGARPVSCLTTKKNRQKETPYLNHTGQTRKSKVTKSLQQQYDQFVLDILTDIANNAVMAYSIFPKSGHIFSKGISKTAGIVI